MVGIGHGGSSVPAAPLHRHPRGAFPRAIHEYPSEPRYRFDDYFARILLDWFFTRIPVETFSYRSFWILEIRPWCRFRSSGERNLRGREFAQCDAKNGCCFSRNAWSLNVGKASVGGLFARWTAFWAFRLLIRFSACGNHGCSVEFFPATRTWILILTGVATLTWAFFWMS